jgi:hypothetical protein
MRKLLAALAVVAALLAVAPLTSAPVPKRLPPSGSIYVWRNGAPPVITVLSPDGERIKQIQLGKEQSQVLSISPGGKHAAVERRGWSERIKGWVPRVYLAELAHPEKESPEPIAAGWNPYLCWSADGRTAYVSIDVEDPDDLPPKRQPRAEVLVYDTTTESGERLEYTRRHRILDVADRGRTFLTSEAIGDERHGWVYRRWVLRGLDECPLSESQDVYPTKFHPDGKRMFATRYSEQWDLQAVLLDPDDGKETVFGWPAKVKQLVGESPIQWELSPDGKRVVVMWRREVENPADWKHPGQCCVRCLGVCDLDGGNFKPIYTPEPKTMDELQKSHIRSFAWR